jgi:hypothetical protein
MLHGCNIYEMFRAGRSSKLVKLTIPGEGLPPCKCCGWHFTSIRRHDLPVRVSDSPVKLPDSPVRVSDCKTCLIPAHTGDIW